MQAKLNQHTPLKCHQRLELPMVSNQKIFSYISRSATNLPRFHALDRNSFPHLEISIFQIAARPGARRKPSIVVIHQSILNLLNFQLF